MRRGLVLAVAAVLAAVPLALAAGETDRVQVGGPGRALTRGFSPATFVEVSAPSDYARVDFDGDGGTWKGPAYRAEGKQDLGGDAKVEWEVVFDREPTSAEAAARAHLGHGWTSVDSGPLAVPHLIGGRSVGRLSAFYVITRGPADSAQHEATLGIPLSRGVFAVARFSFLDPSSDSAGGGYGAYVVDGSTLASTWNRQQAALALRRVAVDGSLPPALVTTVRSGRVVGGAVRDRFAQPVAGARVTLERRAGPGWRRVGTTRTSLSGAYSVRARLRGTYRVTAVLGGFAARSGAVRVGVRR
jgi:Carboxypeptidase regulatory-like domain